MIYIWYFWLPSIWRIEVSAQSNVTNNWHIWHHYQYSRYPSENLLCLDSLLFFTWFMYLGFLNEFRITPMPFTMQLLIHKRWYNYPFDFSSVCFQKTGNHRFQENITKTFGNIEHLIGSARFYINYLTLVRVTISNLNTI